MEVWEAPSEQKISSRWMMEGRTEGGCCAKTKTTAMALMKILMI